MTTTEKQLLKLDILEAIQYYEQRIENLKGKWFLKVRSNFPALGEQADHDIDIFKRCIKRLNNRINSI